MEPPTITRQPADQVAGIGGTADIHGAGERIARAHDQWKLNGDNLVEGGHFAGTTTARLAVTGADSHVCGRLHLRREQRARGGDVEPGELALAGPN